HHQLYASLPGGGRRCSSPSPIAETRRIVPADAWGMTASSSSRCQTANQNCSVGWAKVRADSARRHHRHKRARRAHASAEIRAESTEPWHRPCVSSSAWAQREEHAFAHPTFSFALYSLSLLLSSLPFHF